MPKSIISEPLTDNCITDEVLNRFVGLFYKLKPKSFLQDPRATMLRILSRARPLNDKYYLSDRFLLELNGGKVENVYLTPKLSDHAKRRFFERFNLREMRRFITIIQEVNTGRQLSQREKHRRRIDQSLDAIEYNGKIYLLDPKDHEIVTVFRG